MATTTPLKTAIKHGRLDACALLINHNACLEDILQYAAGYGSVDACKLLLEYEGVDRADMALHCASGSGRLDICEFFIGQGYDVNHRDENDCTPLHYAVAGHTQGYVDVIKLLVDHGSDINARQDDGQTPLIITASYGFLLTCEALLKEGADPNIDDGQGDTPLAYAAWEGEEVICKLLISYGGSCGSNDNEDISRYIRIITDR